MLREERITLILDQLDQERKLSTTGLMAQFDVTEGTIRRDLNELQAKGLLKKVHGGAIPVVSDPPGLTGRMITANSNKIELAKKAISLIRKNQTLIIDGGSSNLALIKQLPKELPLTVFTNSIPAANLLLSFPNIETHLLGGRVLRSSEVSLDITTFEQVGAVRADLSFIGIRSIHPDYGIATLSPDEARLKRKICESSDHVAVMVTNDKLYTTDQYRIGPLTLVDSVITEKNPNSQFTQSIIEMGIEVIS